MTKDATVAASSVCDALDALLAYTEAQDASETVHEVVEALDAAKARAERWRAEALLQARVVDIDLGDESFPAYRSPVP